VQYDPVTDELTYHLKLTDDLVSVNTSIAFDLDLGSVAEVSSESLVGLDAGVMVDLTFGVDLSPLGAGFDFTGATALAAIPILPSGAGVRITAGANDLRVVLRDGTSFEVNLNGATTIGDVKAKIESASSGKVTVAIEAEHKRLALTDTSGDAGATFTVEAINTSKAGFDLGILGRDEDGDGRLGGRPLHGDTLSKHFFIKDDPAIATDDPTLSGTIALSAPDIDASARLFDFVKIGIKNGEGSAGMTVAVTLSDPGTQPNTEGRITLPELLKGLSNLSSLVPPPTVTGFAELALPVVLQPEIPGLTLDPDAKITVFWPDVFNPDTLDVQFVKLDKLQDLEHLGFAAFVQALLGLVDYLSTMEGFGFLDEKLPGINKSTKDLLHIADTIRAKIELFKNNPAQSLQAVEELIEDTFGIPDAPGIPNDDSPLVEIALDGRVLRLDLNLAIGSPQGLILPFNLSLSDLEAPDLGNLVNVGASGQLQVVANADLTLKLGIDLADPFAPTVFLYDTTKLELEAAVRGTTLAFEANVGPLGIKIAGGSLALDEDGLASTVDDPVTFIVDLTDDTGPGGDDPARVQDRRSHSGGSTDAGVEDRADESD
jgi:hypothetical protein